MTETKSTASVYDLFETETDAEVGGTWIDIGPSKFKLARAGGANENFMKTAAKRLKPFQSAIDSLPRKAADELARGIFIDTVLLDWKDVTDRSGKVIPYSREAATKLFTDLPNLFIALQNEANKMSNFTKSNLEAAAKN